jgi:hypothetical protein
MSRLKLHQFSRCHPIHLQLGFTRIFSDQNHDIHLYPGFNESENLPILHKKLESVLNAVSDVP